MSAGRVRSWLGDGRLRTAAVALVVLGLGYLFGQYVFFDLSITVRALLFLGLALVGLCWTAAPGRRQDIPALTMTAALIAFLLYSVIQFEISLLVVIFGTVASLVGVPVLVYGIQSGRLALAGSTVRYATLGLLLLSAGLVGMDLAVGEVQYTASLDEAVTLGNDSRNVTTVTIGSAAATNTFLLREPVNFPSTEACIYTGEQRVDTGVFYRADGEVFHTSVAPRGTIETRMNLRVGSETATAVSGPIPIERAEDCAPADGGPPRILIVNAPPSANATG